MKVKKGFFVSMLILLVILMVGSSFALWQVSLQQETTNKISSGCFSITFLEEDGTNINLENAYPITDMEGTTLMPYKFKIKNNCEAFASYSIALETLEQSTLDINYLKVKLNDEKAKILTKNPEASPVLENAQSAYTLESWYLDVNEEKEYDLRAWLDESVMFDTPNTQNAIWQGKITINSSYINEALKAPGMLRTVSYNETEGMWEYKSSITKIVIQNELKNLENSIKISDESTTQDESIMSYVVPNEDGNTYTAYLQSNKKLVLNSDSSGLFYGFENLVEIEGMEYLDTTNVTSMFQMFRECKNLTSLDLSNFDTSSVTDMSYMFRDCNSLVSLDLSNFDTSSVTTMSDMFSRCTDLTSLNLNSFDTSSVTDMSYMFNGCSSLTSLDLSNFDTSNVTFMNFMFGHCSSLVSLDLSNFDTSLATTTTYMFNNCSSLTYLDVSNFNTSNVIDMSSMFYNCNGLTSLNVSNFDTSSVTDMSDMFRGCNSLISLDVRSFDTSNTTNMSGMFYDNSRLESIIYGDNFVRKDGSNINLMYSRCAANKPTHSSWSGAF